MRVLVGFDGSDGSRDAIALARLLCRLDRDEVLSVEADAGDSPARAIADMALEKGVDLIVVGSRGYGPLGRVFAGSVTSSLICRSPCPVIVLPRTRVARERRGEAPPTSARAAKEANVREYLRGRRAPAPHRTGNGEARSVSR